MKRTTVAFLFCLLPLRGLLAGTPANYEFPIQDSYDATVIGTPPEVCASLPESIPSKVYVLDGISELPDLFWYDNGLRFSAALQKYPAPLVFNIAGTGAAYNSSKMVHMQKAMYEAGFHVINISSPTHLNFLLAASTSHLPGYSPDDARDLYRVMQQAYGKIENKIEVTGFHIAGYSLGALHAAFIAQIDKSEKKFNLQKIYMINPPVSLYNSAIILDKLTADEMPTENGRPNMGAFLDHVLGELANDYRPDQGMRLDSDFLYTAYRQNREAGTFSRHTAAGLIGFSFRLSSGSIVFASDVMTRAGYIVPKEKVFARNESLVYYARACHMVTFQEYCDDMMIPVLQRRFPGKDREELIREVSLYAIEDFLESNPDVRVVSNRDEIILADGELAYLEKLMGDRMTVYPRGGHCGNMNHEVNVHDMISFLKGEGSP